MEKTRDTFKSFAFCVLIFAYCPVGIILPIYLMDVNYAVSTFFLFWFPVCLMLMANLKWMYRTNLIIPFITVNFLMGITAFYFEYAALGLGVWNFSEAQHKLLRTLFNNPNFPFALYGAPIEEFLFWLGATPFCILLYITFDRLLRKKETVSHELLLTAAWPMMLLPFFPVIFRLNGKLKDRNIVNRTALGLVVLFFCVTLLFVEHNAIVKGHWVYAQNRILGLKINGTIPAEELLYYCLGPLFVVLLFLFFELRPEIKLRERSKSNEMDDIARNAIVSVKSKLWKIRKVIAWLNNKLQKFPLLRQHHQTPVERAITPVTAARLSNTRWDDIASTQALIKALTQRRFYDAKELIDALLDDLRDSKRLVDAKTAEQILSVLRRFAWFDPLYTVADAIRANGQRASEVQRQRAQALIEQGRITEAIEGLLALRHQIENDINRQPGDMSNLHFELSEAVGLLGRAYKQLYINANPRSVEPRLQDLAASIKYYGDAYRKRKGDYLWHGVNYLALNTHAVRIQRNDPSAFSAEAQRHALSILQELEIIEEPQPWDFAKRMESFLALGKTPEAITAAKDYLRQDKIDAFSVQGTRRQLIQLWGLTEEKSPGREILPMMTARFAELGGLHEEVVLLPEKYADYKRILDETQCLSIQFLLKALSAAHSVGRIGPDKNTVWGTGFLFNGNWIGNSVAGRNLFLTNAHICSTHKEVVRTLTNSISPRDYVVLLPDFSGQGGRAIPVKVLREIWTSPPSALDATLLEIDAPITGSRPLTTMAPPPAPYATDGRVNIIGNPRGQELRVSLQNNEIVDVRNPYLYYHTNTESGSSGSPVFDLAWNVVALHQGASPAKNANVGVRIDAIVDAMKNALNVKT